MSATRPTATWLATLHFAKGMAYVVVTVISLLMFSQLGLGVALTVGLVALCHLPWVLKCWWKPRVAAALDWRRWVLLTQLLLAASFVAMAKDLGGFEFYPLYVLDLSKIYKTN